jgi:mono/diheme cytochrome c family protein
VNERRRGVLLGVVCVAALLAACREKPSTTNESATSVDASIAPAPSASAAQTLPAERWSEAGMLAEAKLFLDDADFRRTSLVESLANKDNTYSRQRLDAYGLKTKGWDLLPVWNPQSVPVTTQMALDVRAHRVLVLDPATPRLWDGKRPTTMAEWIALGRDVFFRYPLRVETTMSYALEHPEVGEKVGVRASKDGLYPGAVLFTDLEGKRSLGITCAACHSSFDAEGHTITGEARRSFDYGALRLAYHKATGTPVAADLARRMGTWGPGRADVTEDDDEDPVAIPDLWGLRHQTALTQAGTIRHLGASVLAIRQETQLLHSNHHKIRPPRELAYALALFLYSLEPPPQTAAPKDGSSATHGRELFAEHCKGCHSNEAFGGPPIAADKIGTDRALAFGHARGTGKYRPAALIRVSAAAPYFHHGAVATLEDVLSATRLQTSYAKSPLGKGPVMGHTYGTDLPDADRTALLSYLRTL